MRYNIQKTGRVSLCHKNTCLHSEGDNAKRIAIAAGAMLLLVGIAAVVKAIK